MGPTARVDHGARAALAVLACGLMVIGGLPMAMASPTDGHGSRARADELMRLVWSFTGKSAGDELAHDGEGAGDVDGDGFDDLMVSTGYVDDGGINAGKAYLFYGSDQGLGASPGWTFNGSRQAEELGASCGRAGDLNADGFDDIFIGGWGFNGEVLVLHGSSSGPGSAPDWRMVGENSGDCCERASSAGDVNGDGYDDLIVGAYGYPSGERMGKVYVYYGSPSGLGTTANWTHEGAANGDMFGTDIKCAGDVNGDGFSDVLLTASKAFSGRGAAHLFLGSASGLGANPSWTFKAEHDADSMEWCTGAGDVDQDGYDDIIIGAFDNDDGGTGAGKCYLFLGSPTGPGSTYNWSVKGAGSRDGLGSRMKPAGDINDDGYADLILGANQWWQGGPGYCYLFLGSSTGPASAPDWKGVGEGDGDKYGYPVGGAGDVDGDGHDEVFSSARQNDEKAGNGGKVYVYAYNRADIPGHLSVASREAYLPAEEVVLDVVYTGNMGTDVLLEVRDPTGSSLISRQLALGTGAIRTAQLRFALSPSALPGEYAVRAELVRTGMSNTTAFVVMDVQALEVVTNATYAQGDVVDATVRYNGRPSGVTVVLKGPSGEVLVDRVEALGGGPMTSDAATVGLWHLDRCLGSAAPDSSPNRHHGTMRGGAFDSGVFRSSAWSDGIDDHIDLGASTEYCPTGALSLDAWVRFDVDPYGLAGERRYVIDMPGSYGLWYSVQGEGASEPDQFYFDLWDWEGVPTQGVAWQPGTWYLISATYDGTTARVYVNGTLNNEQPLAKALRASAANLTVSTGRALEAFPGRIDDVRLSDVARTPAEAAAAYEASRTIVRIALSRYASPGTYALTAKVVGLDVQGVASFDVLPLPVLTVRTEASYTLGDVVGVVITYDRPPARALLEVRGPDGALVHTATLDLAVASMVHSYALPTDVPAGTYSVTVKILGLDVQGTARFEALPVPAIGLQAGTSYPLGAEAGMVVTYSRPPARVNLEVRGPDGARVHLATLDLTAGTLLHSFVLSRSLRAGIYTATVTVEGGTLSASDTFEVLGFIPDAPGPASATAMRDSVELEWLPSEWDGGVPLLGYVVLRGAAPGAMTDISEVPATEHSFNDTSIVHGTAYFYAVAARNAIGRSQPTSPVSATVVGSPSPPRDLTASAASVVMLAWDAPADDGGSPLTGFRIYKGTQSGGLVFLSAVGADARSFEDAMVLKGHSYMYEVTAVTMLYESWPSNIVSASVLGVPDPPRDLSASLKGSTIMLSWRPPASDGGSPVTGYILYRGTGPGPYVRIAEVTGDALSYEDSAGSDRTYYYRVQAVNERGLSEMSAESSVAPPPEEERPFPWLLLALVVIVVILLFSLIAVLSVMRSRRQEGEAAPQADLVPVGGPGEEPDEEVIVTMQETPPPKGGT